MSTSHQLLSTEEHTNKQPSTWTQLGRFLSTAFLFIMSFLSRLFGIGKKKDEFRGEKDISSHRREVESQSVPREQATPSPKSAFLRTAGVISKDAHDEKSPIEITVDSTILDSAVPSENKGEPVLPSASNSEGSAVPKVDSSSNENAPAAGLLPEPGLEDSKNTLVIKNLPFKFTKPELDQLLNAHQAKSKNVRMLRDGSGRFTGIAFIRCPSKEEAGRLIIGMNNLDIGGRAIQVEFKKKKKKGTQPKNGVAPSATTAAPVAPYAAPVYHPSQVPPPGFQGRSYISASGNLRTSGGVVPLRSSNMLTSSTSSVEDEEYLNHLPYGRRRSLASSTSSVDDEEYLPRQLGTSTDDANRAYAYPHSRLSLSSSGGVQNPRFAMPNVRPVRQPYGPDGKSNGFSNEYRRARTTAQV